MVYIISPESILNLKAYKDIDFRNYCLYNIYPFIIDTVQNKKDAASKISQDIYSLSLCYNCPLYITIMSNKWYFSNLDFGVKSFRNLGKVAELDNIFIKYKSYDISDLQTLKIDREMAYFKSNLSEIKQSVSEKIKGVNCKNGDLYCFKITKERGIEELK